jgi:GxxExxY protein
MQRFATSIFRALRLYLHALYEIGFSQRILLVISLKLNFSIMTENEISHKIIGCAIELHKTLGPGLLESVYETGLAFDLTETGLKVRTQVPMPLIYKGIRQEIGYRLDLIVEEKVIVELKSVEMLAPVHFAQTLTYLKLADKRLALLINFNTKVLKDGIHRIVNNL